MQRFFFILLLSLYTISASAQNDSSIQISVLTCGTGEELYASFGHTGVRIKDLRNNIDEVYNYGMFNFGDPDFYTKFTRGKLLYYIGKENFEDFLSIYQYEKRSVREQILHLTEEQKQKIINYLHENIKPENKNYKYDFLYDNCATRIRDIFPATLGNNFHYGSVLEGKSVTFRALLNAYLVNSHWSRLGINLLLSSPIDKVMTETQSMFLPDMLFIGISRATYNNRTIVSATHTLIPQDSPVAASLNQPLWCMMGLLLLTLMIFFIKPLHGLKNIWSFLLLFVSGFLGCIMLFMWLGTDHKACANNFNILWALPTNLIVAFTIFSPKKWHKIYSLLAIGLMMVAMIIHISGIQVMPLIEILPFFFCLLYIYIYCYKRCLPMRSA